MCKFAMCLHLKNKQTNTKTKNKTKYKTLPPPPHTKKTLVLFSPFGVINLFHENFISAILWCSFCNKGYNIGHFVPISSTLVRGATPYLIPFPIYPSPSWGREAGGENNFTTTKQSKAQLPFSTHQYQNWWHPPLFHQTCHTWFKHAPLKIVKFSTFSFML